MRDRLGFVKDAKPVTTPSGRFPAQVKEIVDSVGCLRLSQCESCYLIT